MMLKAAALLAGDLQHLLRYVRADHPALGAYGTPERKGEVTRAAADIEGRRPRAYLGQHHPHVAPTMVEPGRHEIVQPVIGAGDVVEHLANLTRLGAREFRRPALF